VVYVSARLKDVVNSAAQLHGWNVQPAVNVGVQVNVPMPTEEERAEMRAIDAKLVAFVRQYGGKQLRVLNHYVTPET
jgi:hypothetical protein